MVDGLAEKLRKFLVVEDLEAATRRNLAHSGWVEVVVVVAVAALHENAAVTQALRKYLTPNIIQMHSCSG